MASIGVPDAKELEGRKDGENRPSVQSRDFFWDSVTLYVVGTILALSAITFITEYVRGSDVQCFFNRSAVADSFENVGAYVNEKCAASLPPAEYLPAFIAIHAILIVAPHYIWLNVFAAKLDSFFHLVSGLVRTRDPCTGDYPESNYVISKQLDLFSSGTLRSNSMYRVYCLKLSIQILLCLGGFVLVGEFLSDFDDTFTCPDDRDESWSDGWPLTGKTVMCVFTSLRLLHKIWILYLILLLTATLCLCVALVWLIDYHAKELSLDKVAAFSFQSSLPFHHFTPPIALLMNRGGFSPTAYTILSFFLAPSFKRNNSYYIQTDYDFLLVKLFRTDGGLATVLREVHLLRLLKELNNVELSRISSHKTVIEFDDNKKAMVDRRFLNADLGWRDFELVDKHDTVDTHTPLLLPPTIRGVVMGLSARCVGSVIDPPPPDLPDKLLCGALCIVFDSESIGFAGALARVFERVAVINFSKTYSDYENPVCVNVNNSSLVVGMTTPHDIIMTDRIIETQVDTGEENTKLITRKRAVTRFYDDFIDEIWKPGYIYSKKDDEMKAAGRGRTIRVEDLTHLQLAQYLTDYIVIGPISTDLQRATVNMFLDTKKGFISQDAVLVTLQPLEISGVKRAECHLFSQFIPFGFKPLPHIAPDPTRVEALLLRTHPHIYSWPQKNTTWSGAREIPNITRDIQQPSALNEWVVTTGEISSKFRFSLFTCESSRLLQSQPSAAKLSQLATTGAQSAVKQDKGATPQ